MGWIFKQYRSAFWAYLIGSGIISVILGNTGPALFGAWVATFFFSYVFLTIWIIARILMATFIPK